MKKIILLIAFVIVSFWSSRLIYADQFTPWNPDFVWPLPLDPSSPEFQNLAWQANNWWSSTILKVRVTEKVPWADCNPVTKSGSSEPITLSDWNPVYECTIERWFWTVKSTIWQIIKYLTYITWLAGVLYIIINGIMLSMSWLEQSMKDTAKKNIKKVLIWLLLLLLSWVFLNMIAPWIYQ